jgi:cytochrome c-type biogenesis protein CcmH
MRQIGAKCDIVSYLRQFAQGQTAPLFASRVWAYLMFSIGGAMAGIWFWVVAGAMGFAVSAFLLRALARGSDVAAAGPMALELYKGQLAEVERDLAKGTLEAGEAERLRTEVQRRMLEAAKSTQAPAIQAPATQAPATQAPATQAPATRVSGLSQSLGFGAIIAALAGAIALYFTLGAPDYPDLPLSKRLALAAEAYNARPSQFEAEAAAPPPAPVQPDPEFLALIEQLRAAVKARPSDVQGQTLLARNEAQLGNFAASSRAYEAVIAAKGDAASAEDYSGAAQAMIVAAGGIVTRQAEAALMQTLKLDPQNGLARYFAGLMFAQTGRPDRAFEFWEPLARTSAADAPWRAPLAALLPEVASAAGINYAAPADLAQIGPDAADMAAAADMTSDEQRIMINMMVTGLEARLLEAGGTGEEWARLITSLGVLGEMPRAEVALRAARAAMAADPTAVQLINAAAAQTGLESGREPGLAP